MAVAMAIVIRKAGPDQRQLAAAGIQVPALAAFTQPDRAGSTGLQVVGIECLFFGQRFQPQIAGVIHPVQRLNDVIDLQLDNVDDGIVA